MFFFIWGGRGSSFFRSSFVLGGTSLTLHFFVIPTVIAHQLERGTLKLLSLLYSTTLAKSMCSYICYEGAICIDSEIVVTRILLVKARQKFSQVSKDNVGCSSSGKRTCCI
jgi:hypothetical protein